MKKLFPLLFLVLSILAGIACQVEQEKHVVGSSYPTPKGDGLGVVSSSHWQEYAIAGDGGNNVLHWVDGGPAWASGSDIFTPAGDLSGSATSQTVVGLRGQPIAAGTSGPGYLMAFGAGTAWSPLPPGTTGQTLHTNGSAAASWSFLNLSSEATGTLPIANGGTGLTSAGSANTVLLSDGGAFSTGQITDSYISSSAAITGSKVASASSASLGVIELAGNLGGSATSPTVTGLTIPSQTTGDILAFDGGAWGRVAAGTSGYLLQTASTAGPPTWVDPSTLAPNLANATIASQAAGDILAYSGSAWVRVPAGTSGLFLKTVGDAGVPTWASAGTAPSPAQVDTNQTNTNSSYGDLATVGPAVTVTTSTTALVFISAAAANLGTSSGSGYISVAVSGATTVAASDANGTFFSSTTANFFASLSRGIYFTGLTAGSNTFTVKYKDDSASSNWTFTNRTIAVFPL